MVINSVKVIWVEQSPNHQDNENMVLNLNCLRMVMGTVRDRFVIIKSKYA